MEQNHNSEQNFEKLDRFWSDAFEEIDKIEIDTMSFRKPELPLARIKKIMKIDEDIKNMMISAEAPVIFAKAIELFIREMTVRAWIHTERNRRRTLQRSDVISSLTDGDTDQYDFLIDLIPQEEINSCNFNGSSTCLKQDSNTPLETQDTNLSEVYTRFVNNSEYMKSENVNFLNLGGSELKIDNKTNYNNPKFQYVIQVPSENQLKIPPTSQLPNNIQNIGLSNIMLAPPNLNTGNIRSYNAYSHNTDNIYSVDIDKCDEIDTKCRKES